MDSKTESDLIVYGVACYCVSVDATGEHRQHIPFANLRFDRERSQYVITDGGEEIRMNAPPPMQKEGLALRDRILELERKLLDCETQEQWCAVHAELEAAWEEYRRMRDVG
jgi:hypothetical protein